jgi:hypothetical protein
MDKKFIVTKDEPTAMALKANGIREVGHIGEVYIFLNQLPNNFNFANFDKTKLAYTDILSL